MTADCMACRGKRVSTDTTSQYQRDSLCPKHRRELTIAELRRSIALAEKCTLSIHDEAYVDNLRHLLALEGGQ